MKIKRQYPAKRWGEAFPLGNGHMGAMVYGNINEERIDLSELTFFSGEKSSENDQDGAADAFQIMRKQALQGDYDAMTQTADQVIGVRHNYGTNLPVGYLNIQTKQGSTVSEDYEAWLDIRDGVSGTSFSVNGNKNIRTCFVSHEDQVMVYRMECEGSPQDIQIQFQSFREKEKAVYNETGGSFCCQALETMHSDGTSGVNLYGEFLAEADGAVEYTSEGIDIKGASSIVLFLAMDTDFGKSSWDKEKVHNRLIGSWIKGYEILLQRHTADMNGMYDRSVLEIFESEGRQGELIPRMYQMGRYLLYSSSREDSVLPAHLQGVWNDNVACRIGWTCDMHLDINTQMNYWPAEVTGLSETVHPLFRWMTEELIPAGETTAKKTYGYSGWVAELVSNAWGFSAPYWAEPLAPCPTGGVWILTHMWEHYLTTGDLEFLEKTALPAIEGAAKFFDAYVFENGDGCLTCGPSISPENSFVKDGTVYHNSIGCTYEILMIRELFEIYESTCDILSRHTELEMRIREKKERLLPYRILEDGTIAEWAHDYPSADAQHRHTSHLLGLFPFAQITAEMPELAQAAEKTIEKKITPKENWEDTGWARSMLMLYEARLHHPQMAWYHIQEMLDKLLEPNGMIIHPPTRGAGSFDNVYELDGNTGLTSCIAEMLMQSHKNILQLLPCVPKEWKVGQINGLRARGGLKVDLKWDDTGAEAVVTSQKSGVYVIKYGQEEAKEVSLEAGVPTVFQWQNWGQL